MRSQLHPVPEQWHGPGVAERRHGGLHDRLDGHEGTGENANKVTLSASGGAATLEEFSRYPLTGSVSGAFDGVVFNNWTGTVLKTSADATWNETTNAVDLRQTGLYEVCIQANITPGSGTWPVAVGISSTTAARPVLPRAAFPAGRGVSTGPPCLWPQGGNP